MDWDSDPHPTKPGRVIRSFGKDLESVAFAVLTFLSGGILLFILCCFMTKCLQCYKERQRRKRRRALGEDDDNDEWTTAIMTGAFENCEQDDNSSHRLVDL